MSRKRDSQQIELAAETISGALVEVVQSTIDDRTPEPSRGLIAEFLEIDDRAAPGDSGGPTELMTTLIVIRWLSLARKALADRPDRVEQVLAWIETALGRRYRARARYTSGILESDSAAADTMEYADALRDDFLPSFVWLLAGTVAVYGAGDAGWLRGLEPAEV